MFISFFAKRKNFLTFRDIPKFGALQPAALGPSQQTGPLTAASTQTGPPANQSQSSEGQSQRTSSNKFVQPMRNKL